MRPPRRDTYCHVMAIVHGKSEQIICEYIRSNLRISHEIKSRDNGRNSIQVNGLLNKQVLNSSVFSSISSFSKNYVNIKCEKGKLVDFKLFIIMDLDDCDEEVERAFKDKTMFKNHPLYDYIIPIYNKPNLEASMGAIDIPIENKKDYIKIFPINNKKECTLAENIAEIDNLLGKLKECECTNLDLYVDYCLKIAKKQHKSII